MGIAQNLLKVYTQLKTNLSRFWIVVTNFKFIQYIIHFINPVFSCIPSTRHIRVSNDFVLGVFSCQPEFIIPKRHEIFTLQLPQTCAKHIITLSRFGECTFYHTKWGVSCYELVSKSNLSYEFTKLNIYRTSFMQGNTNKLKRCNNCSSPYLTSPRSSFV